MNKVDTIIVGGGIVALGIVGWLVVAPLMSGDRKPPTPMPAPLISPAPNFNKADPNSPVGKMVADNAVLMAKPDKSTNEIEVQHCLISYTGSVAKEARTKEAAEELAAELYARAKSGEDFFSIVHKYSDDDREAGKYTMLLSGTADMGKKIALRSGMVPAFGDVGWKLEVGEIGCSLNDPKTSPYGWHIIKRIR